MCETFLKMVVSEELEFVRSNNACLNCLMKFHGVKIIGINSDVVQVTSLIIVCCISRELDKIVVQCQIDF